MRDMFYNYDHNIQNLDHLNNNNFYTFPEILDSCNCAHILTNKKGDEIGIIVKEGSKFYLYFDFYSDSTEDIRSELEKGTLVLDVLDNKREIVATTTPELCDYINELRVTLQSSPKGPLKYGVYRMHLYLKIEDEIYTLFSEEDGILNID